MMERARSPALLDYQWAFAAKPLNCRGWLLGAACRGKNWGDGARIFGDFSGRSGSYHRPMLRKANPPTDRAAEAAGLKQYKGNGQLAN
jgi:hypothetical protein